MTQEPHNPMALALELAAEAAAAEEVPVGAVVLLDGVVIGRGRNRMRALGDPLAHAEMLALADAFRNSGAARLSEADLYVTLEPCTMCAGAISHARVRRVYYGAPDPKGGAIDHGVRFFEQPACLHRPEVIAGLRESDAAILLRRFFADRR